jgi:hypothetical protein
MRFAKSLKEKDLALSPLSARGMRFGQARGGCPLNKKLRFGGKPTLKRWVPLSRPTFFLARQSGRKIARRTKIQLQLKTTCRVLSAGQPFAAS